MGRHLDRLLHAGLRLTGASLLASLPVLALPQGRVEAGADLPTPDALEEPELSPAAAEVHRILRRARDPLGPPPDVASLELAPVASEALPLLIDILRARQVPAIGELRAQTLSESQEEILLGALATLERTRVLDAMQRMLAAQSTLASRAAALRLIGRVGKSADVPLLLGLPLERGEAEVAGPLAAAFRVGLAELVRREHDALNQVASLWTYRPAPLLPALIEGLGDAGDPRALALFDDVLLRHEDLLMPVLAQVRRIGASRSLVVNEQLAYRLRPHLDPHSAACRQAVLALASLRDHESIPALIELLDHGSEGLRTDAYFALRELTGLRLHQDYDLWSGWHAKELAWVREQSSQVLRRLGSTSQAEVAQAVGELARRRLFNDLWAAELVPLLGHDSSSIRTLTAHALASLGSPYVALELVRSLDDVDPAVRGAAYAALRATTGLTLAAEPEAWRAALVGTEL